MFKKFKAIWSKNPISRSLAESKAAMQLYRSNPEVKAEVDKELAERDDQFREDMADFTRRIVPLL